MSIKTLRRAKSSGEQKKNARTHSQQTGSKVNKPLLVCVGVGAKREMEVGNLWISHGKLTQLLSPTPVGGWHLAALHLPKRSGPPLVARAPGQQGVAELLAHPTRCPLPHIALRWTSARLVGLAANAPRWLATCQQRSGRAPWLARGAPCMPTSHAHSTHLHNLWPTSTRHALPKTIGFWPFDSQNPQDHAT